MKKATLTPNALADFLDLKDGHGKNLQPFCDAAELICTAWAETELADSHAARQALSMTAAWLMATGVTDPDKMRDLPLQIRYFINEAKPSPCATGNCPV